MDSALADDSVNLLVNKERFSKSILLLFVLVIVLLLQRPSVLFVSPSPDLAHCPSCGIQPKTTGPCKGLPCK